MNKLFLSFLLLIVALQSYSQEIQLHFDPRHALHSDVAPRNYFTATLQMFKPDKWGSTFGFVDLDFNQSKGNIGLAYMEIYRNIKIGNSPIMPHLEYNGGIVRGNNNSGFSIPNAYLVGASFVKTFGKVNLETYVVYKYNAFDKVSNDVQWTGIWNTSLFDGVLTMSGFIDVWTENKDRVAAKGGKKVILLTEPQFWYNFDDHLSFGSEIEISNNFYANYNNKLYICPTIAAKWVF